MILESIAEYIFSQANVVKFKTGNSPRLFLYEKPLGAVGDEPYALLLTDIQGASIDEELPDYHKSRIQLIVSSDDHDEGYRLALDLSKDMTIHGLDLEDMHIYKCVPLNLPIRFRRNEQNRIEFSVNFNIILRKR